MADQLEQDGHEIIGRNWKTRVCEIDIISKKDGTIYFTEVKYRRQSAQGEGFEYITAHKLHRMDFAVQIWLQYHTWKGDYQLAAAAVSGPACEEVEITEL